MPKPAVILATLLLLAAAYLAGRAHVVGTIRYALIDWLRQPPAALEVTIPPQPDAYDPIAMFDELDKRLATRLDSLAVGHAILDEMIASGPGRRLFLADSMRDRIRAALPAWEGSAIPLQPEVSAWFTAEGVRVDMVRINSPPGITLWCVVARPVEDGGPGPAVLFLHGLGGSAADLVSDADYHHGAVFELARRGYRVVAPLLPSNTPRDRMALHVRALYAGWTGSQVEHWQVRAALDYLMSLPDVDTTRVGLYGISVGGGRALRLAALDARPRAVVTSGTLAERTTWWFGDRLEISHVGAIPAQPEFLDDANIVALIHPRPLAIEVGHEDPRYPSTARNFERLAGLYEATGDSGRIALLDFPGGHETFLARSAPFLDRWLKAPLPD